MAEGLFARLAHFRFAWIDQPAGGILSEQWRRRRIGRKGKKYLDTENIWSTEEKKNEDGKGGKHLEKENICSAEEEKNRVGKSKHLKGQLVPRVGNVTLFSSWRSLVVPCG